MEQSANQDAQRRLNLLLERDARLRLFQQIHQNDNYEWYRAAGGCICRNCGLTYREHYDDLEHPLNSGEYDKRLCNGDVVHL